MVKKVLELNKVVLSLGLMVIAMGAFKGEPMTIVLAFMLGQWLLTTALYIKAGKRH